MDETVEQTYEAPPPQPQLSFQYSLEDLRYIMQAIEEERNDY